MGGAYNVDGILKVMVGGLERELEERLEGRVWGMGASPGLPTRSSAAEIGGTAADKWQMDNEQIVRMRSDIDGSAVIVDDEGSLLLAANVRESSNGAPSSRTGRVKDWIRRKVRRR